MEPRFLLVVHGGAGTIPRSEMTPRLEAAYRSTLAESLRAGHAVLAAEDTSVDAVNAAVNVLEDSPLFNAGRGAAFTSAGTNEMDAAIMEGRTLRAGAVAAVTHIRNPIDLARLVMERSSHVLLGGEGAEAFAREQGMELVPQSYFFTERRWESMRRARAAEEAGLPVARLGRPDERHGTVGAVALDVHGDLAAGTSTGGLTNKHPGRIGDSPIIGAGTYASNEGCAVSATGTGEDFMRGVVAYDICARVRYLGQSVREAAEHVVGRVLVERGGEGGVIALGRDGSFAAPFNTPGMYRGWTGPDGRITVHIYDDEDEGGRGWPKKT